MDKPNEKFGLTKILCDCTQAHKCHNFPIKAGAFARCVVWIDLKSFKPQPGKEKAKEFEKLYITGEGR